MAGPDDSGPPLPPDGDVQANELPEAAGRRLSGQTWSSALTVADLAACEAMGLRPVALVQGFCVMQWGFYTMAGAGSWGSGPPSQATGAAGPYAGRNSGASGGYQESWPCPHGIASLDHRWGYNLEQSWVEAAWSQGFGSAYRRMVDEAREAGAHGIVGVVDRAEYLGEQSVVEFHLSGTAVMVDGTGPAPTLWSTYLAGQRLGKLFEAGFVPVSVAAAMASVQMWPNCQTEYLMNGGIGIGPMWGGSAGGEITQVTRAETAVRHLARSAVRAQLGLDTLHGASFAVSRRQSGTGGHVIECTLRGTRVRRFKDFDPLPAPRPTVPLS
ncbi:MAG TPA: hypothetical protein VK386_09740 [Acidimicrobiales bacterium]|nr:hypothetical protein [Acidimicrobiales bacterium]